MNEESKYQNQIQQPSYLQTSQWACFKHAFGWESNTVGDVFVLSRRLPYINRLMMYVPELWVDDLNEVDDLVAFAKAKKPMFLRLEILNKIDGTHFALPCHSRVGSPVRRSDIGNLYNNSGSPTSNSIRVEDDSETRMKYMDSKNAENITQKLKESGFVKAFEELQPEHRQIIDLSQTNDEILQNMKEKGRYNTRLAKKKGVRVEITEGNDPLAPEKLKIVFDLYQKTADRKSISGRNLVYFEKLLENLKDEIVIAATYIENIPLAGSLTILRNGVASYLYGGSSLDQRELMAPYLLHYEVMKYAKVHNCTTYDLLAIAPPNEPNHKFANLTRFKQQFGGKSIQIIGSYDLVLKPFWYWTFKILERHRRI